MGMTRLFKNHGKSVGYWEISVTDNAELKISHAKTLDGNAVTRITAVAGKNIGRANETTPLEQAHKEMAARIQKQLDKGYVASMEEADADPVNAMGLEPPVLATVIEKVKPESIDWDTATLQPKLNGNRCLYKNGQLYSRGGKEIKLPHILNAIKTYGLDHLHLDGELYIHGVPLQHINSLIKDPRKESEALEYHIYDVVDTEKSFHDRFITPLLFGGTVPQGIIEFVDTVPVYNMDEVKDLDAEWVKEGFEGSILRHGTQGYEVGKRSRKLLKVKMYQDAEAEVIGYDDRADNHVEGKDPLHNFVWVCRNPFNPETTFEVTPQGSWVEVHEQRQSVGAFIGKQLKFKYFELSEARIPQQPVALGWRDEL